MRAAQIPSLRVLLHEPVDIPFVCYYAMASAKPDLYGNLPSLPWHYALRVALTHGRMARLS